MLWFYETDSSEYIFQSIYDIIANYKACVSFVKKVQQIAVKKELLVIGVLLSLLYQEQGKCIPMKAIEFLQVCFVID
jgi:hypothetical protein